MIEGKVTSVNDVQYSKEPHPIALVLISSKLLKEVQCSNVYFPVFCAFNVTVLRLEQYPKADSFAPKLTGFEIVTEVNDSHFLNTSPFIEVIVAGIITLSMPEEKNERLPRMCIWEGKVICVKDVQFLKALEFNVEYEERLLPNSTYPKLEQESKERVVMLFGIVGTDVMLAHSLMNNFLTESVYVTDDNAEQDLISILIVSSGKTIDTKSVILDPLKVTGFFTFSVLPSLYVNKANGTL